MKKYNIRQMIQKKSLSRRPLICLKGIHSCIAISEQLLVFQVSGVIFESVAVWIFFIFVISMPET